MIKIVNKIIVTMTKTVDCLLEKMKLPNCCPLTPSIAEVTVTAGVKVPSASSAEPPIKAGMISHFLVLTKA